MNNKLIRALCVGALYFAAPHGAHATLYSIEHKYGVDQASQMADQACVALPASYTIDAMVAALHGHIDTTHVVPKGVTMIAYAEPEDGKNKSMPIFDNIDMCQTVLARFRAHQFPIFPQ
jgi:hypothetical protein